VPAIGILRRIQALHALGYTGPQIADHAGISVHSLRSIAYHDSAVVLTTTARKVIDAYEALCMVRPIGQYANRARAIAARRGWPPPLAYDDIDDPDEQPRGWQYAGIDRKSRRDILHELDDQHAGITAACRALKVTRRTIEKWAARNDLTPLYSRLVEREQPRYWRNGGAEGGAA
jgi:hypothetical protein